MLSHLAVCDAMRAAGGELLIEFVRLFGRQRDLIALVAGVLAPLAVSAALAPFRTSFSSAGFSITDAALVLVAVVVAVAAYGSRLPGYLAAASSAVWFDFFLVYPYERFTIAARANAETTVLLLLIGAIVTELAVWGRRQQAAASRRSGYVGGLYAVAEAASGRGSTTELVREVAGEISQLLTLYSCTFQHGVSGVGAAARLHHDGRVTMGGQEWPVDERGLPAGQNLELLVESGGLLQGRFLMLPTDDARPRLENRLIAAALADQVGAALGRHRAP